MKTVLRSALVFAALTVLAIPSNAQDKSGAKKKSKGSSAAQAPAPEKMSPSPDEGGGGRGGGRPAPAPEFDNPAPGPKSTTAASDDVGGVSTLTRFFGGDGSLAAVAALIGFGGGVGGSSTAA